MLKIRESLNEEIRKKKDDKIAEAFIEFLKKKPVKSVLLYASFGSEVDTWKIFEICLENSIKTAFPKVKGNYLELYLVEDRNQLCLTYKSILEPKNGERIDIEKIDLIVVPGIAFDCKGFRIGYGGGFYDRLLLNRKGLTVGLAYEEQIINEIPIDPFDQKVDLIITDERIISCV